MDAAPLPDSPKTEPPPDNLKSQYLRFETLRRKVAPPDFMFIDEALDRLGYQLYGHKWRYCPQLKDLPYLYQKATDNWPQGYYSFHYEWKRNRWHIKREPIAVSKEDRPAYRRTRAMFAEAVKRLRIALYQGELCGHSHSISLDQIESSRRGIWTKMIIPIYYTGQLYEVSARDKRLRKEQILIGRDKFEQWVSGQALQLVIPAGTKMATDLEGLKEVIERHVLNEGYKLYLSEIEAPVAGVLRKCRMKSPAETARKLFSILDTKVRMRRAPPMSGDSPEPMQKDLPNLLRVINEECLRQREAANQSQVTHREL